MFRCLERAAWGGGLCSLSSTHKLFLADFHDGHCSLKDTIWNSAGGHEISLPSVRRVSPSHFRAIHPNDRPMTAFRPCGVALARAQRRFATLSNPACFMSGVRPVAVIGSGLWWKIIFQFGAG